MDLNWGTVPDWLAAVSTFAAVAVALRFGMRDGKRLREERAAAEEDRAAFRREQAEQAAAAKRRLAAQVTVTTERYIDDTGELKLCWTVHNGAEEPISSVAIVQRYQAGSEPLVVQTWPVIEARGNREERPREFWRNAVLRQVQFTDGAGQRWQRTEQGTLRPIVSDDPDGLPMVFLQL